ncbi:MAG: SpoIIE family protein phosphatase [Planctomycetota bacterium]
MGRRLVVVAERDHSFVDLDERSTVSIGRAPENDVVVKDDMVSRRHALIERDPGGALRVRDLKSFNGTYLNERRIRDEPLGLWDAVRVGRTKMFLVERDETPSGEGAAPAPQPASQPAAAAAPEPAQEERHEEAMSKTRTLDVGDAGEMRRVIDEIVRQERQALEREVSRRIRDESGPAVLASATGYRVRVRRDGPEDGGGDFFDVFRDAMLPNDLFLALGSVSGVGVAACVAATVARHTVRGYLATRDEAPGESLPPLSEVLAATLHPGSALSLLLCRLDTTSGRARIAALGGCGALHYKAASEEVEVLRAPGRRDEEAIRVEVLEATLRDDDRLVLTSDGGGALRRPDGEPFGAERLTAAFAAKARLPLKELLADLGQEYEAFSPGARERDVTLIGIAPKGEA